MTILLSLIVSLSAFADSVAPVGVSASPSSCAPALSTKPAMSASSMISRLLEERGKALGATNVGLFEVSMRGGETMISKIYFSTDGTDPMSPELQREFIGRFSKRAHRVQRVNSWSINLARGGVIINSIPVR